METAGDGPNDPKWRFDPASPPDRFTRQMLGRMSISHLLMCADPETSPLSETQQASFDAAYAELNRDMNRRIESAVQKAMPKLDFKWPTPNVDLSALAPKIDFSSVNEAAARSLSASTRASFERIQRDLTANLVTAQSIRPVAVTPFETPDPAPPTESRETEQEQEQATEPPEPPEPLAEEAGPKAEAVGALEGEVTPDELLVKVDDDLNQLALLGNVVELLEEQSVLMRQQRAVVQSQHDSAARGAVFYVVVGLGSALSGIATVVGLGDGSDALLSLALLALVAFGAWLAYFLRQRKQEQED